MFFLQPEHSLAGIKLNDFCYLVFFGVTRYMLTKTLHASVCECASVLCMCVCVGSSSVVVCVSVCLAVCVLLVGGATCLLVLQIFATKLFQKNKIPAC